MTVKGNLFILSAPSGAGKSSLIKALLSTTETATTKAYPQNSPEQNAACQDFASKQFYDQRKMQVSISHTTRSPRPGEIDGEHYHFVSHDKFKKLIAQKAFYEYAEVFGNFYGTSVASIDEQLAQGIDVFLDIDWQGAQQVRLKKPEVTTIFICPPSKAALESRLRARAQDSEETIRERMLSAQSECSHYQEFSYIIVNDNFEQALADLKIIVANQRLKLSQQAQLHHVLFSELTQQ